MSIKKIVLIVAIFAFVLTGISTTMPASANAAGWVSVKCVQIGPSKDGNIYVRLTALDNSFTRVWYVLNADAANRMMACILTAMTNDLNLQAYIDAGVAYSEVRNLYMFAAE